MPSAGDSIDPPITQEMLMSKSPEFLAKMPREMTPEELEVFAAECQRQSLLLRDDPHEKEIMDFLESIADTDDWE